MMAIAASAAFGIFWEARQLAGLQAMDKILATAWLETVAYRARRVTYRAIESQFIARAQALAPAYLPSGTLQSLTELLARRRVLPEET